MRVEQLNQFGEVGERTRQPINLIDDDYIEPSSANLIKKLLERGPLHRPTRIAAVVVMIAGQSPALVRLTLDIGLRRLPLSVEGVEVLFEPLVGRDPSIDRAAQTAFGRQIFHRDASPENALLQPIATAPTSSFVVSLLHSRQQSLPDGARRSDDRSSSSWSSLRRFGTGFEKSGHSRRSRPRGSRPARAFLPLSYQHGPGFQADAVWRLRRTPVEGNGGALLLVGGKHPLNRLVETAERIGLQSVSQDPHQ